MKVLLFVLIAFSLLSCSNRQMRAKVRIISIQAGSTWYPDESRQIVFRDIDTLASIGDTIKFTDEYIPFKAIILSKDSK